MKKRLISVLLVLVLLLGLLPTVALAADPEPVRTAKDFADMTPTGNYYLENDIEISTPYPKEFSGTFDGRGCKITAKIESNEANTGVFKKLVGGAKIMGLTVVGTVTSDDNCTGGIAGLADTANGTVSFENCKNAAAVTGAGRGTGGILGSCKSSKNTLEIRGCVNTGTISGKNNTGGIAGNLNLGTVVDCYNQAEKISGTGGQIGGLVGFAGTLASLTNCYTVSTVSAGSTRAAIACGNANAVISNCYAKQFTEDDELALVNTVTVDVKTSFKSETEMKNEAFAATLGTAFAAKSGDYPVLKWELGGSEPETPTLVSIAVKDGYKSTYTVDEELESITLVLTYSDDSKKEITEGFTVTGFDSSKAAESLTLTVTYEDLSTTFTVKVEDKSQPDQPDQPAGPWDGTTKTQPKGKGTAADPYLIASGAELAWFANEVSANGKTGIYGELTGDIDLNEQTWTAIGAIANTYAGGFDGKGHAVSGLKDSALFGYIAETGTIKNLRVDGNVSVSNYAAILCISNKGIIDTCAVSGTVTALHGFGSYAAGGIACQNAGAASVIRNCASSADVRNETTYFATALNTGGLTGNNYGTIENSYATGSVWADEGKYSNTCIGGLMGLNGSTGKIIGCYSAGTVTGPAAGIGAFAGSSKGTIAEGYYNTDASANAVADGTASGLRGMSDAEMKDDSFIKDCLGLENYHRDTDNINHGYPVHAWQGGSPVEVSEDEKNATLDVQAITLRDLGQAAEIERLRAEADAEADDMLDGLTLTEINEYLEAWDENAEFKTKEEARPIFRQMYYRQVEAAYEEAHGVSIDLSSDGTIQPDSDGVYHIRTAARLELVTEGKNKSAITWAASPAGVIDLETGKLTLPESGTQSLTLTATAASGAATKSRDISVVLYSATQQSGAVLDEIAQKLAQKDAFLQPVQIRGQSTVQDAMNFWLYENGYEREGVDEKGNRIPGSTAEFEVAFVSAGTRVTAAQKDYLAADGTVTFYKGEAGTTSVNQIVYEGVQLKLTKGGVEKTVTVNVHIGWDIDEAMSIMQTELGKLTWDAIRGSNTNTSHEAEIKDETTGLTTFNGTVVDGQVSENLRVPVSASGAAYQVAFGFTALPDSAISSTSVSGNTCNVTLKRPLKGAEPKTFDLQLIAFFDDTFDAYTLQSLKSRTSDGLSAYRAYKTFRITIAPNEDGDLSSVITKAIKEHFLENCVDFVDQTTVIDPDHLTADVQLPQPALLEKIGILTDRPNQMAIFTSSDPDLLNAYGYHLQVFRPLPGEEAKQAELTVAVYERVKSDTENATSSRGALLGSYTFTLTVEPMDQTEFDAAAAMMKQYATDEVYWEGIKGQNTSKTEVTSDLDGFEEIHIVDGKVEYTRGTINMDFGGIEIDDLPGYDPMGYQNWREFRSSKPTVITDETLRVTTPDYDTKVTVDSVMTYTKYADYYEHFCLDKEGNELTTDTANRYREVFKQFYKVPVKAELTVKGKLGENPNPGTKTTLTVTVTVDGKGYKDFKTYENYKYTTQVGTDDTVTAMDVMADFFEKTGYKSDLIENGGVYASYITDTNEVTLRALMDDLAYSGWIYKYNGVYTDFVAGEQNVENNAEIYFLFTQNYLLEEGFGDHDKNKALADDVIAKIDAIPALDEITLDDANTINLAKRAYDQLDETVCDALIPAEKTEKLEKALEKLAELQKKAEEEAALKKDQDAAAKVKQMIEALPQTITTVDEEQILAAEAAYAKLSKRAKGFVDNYEKLQNARTALDAAKKREADQAAAAKVEKQIEDLPTDVKTTDEAAIKAARKAFENLTADQQGMVTNLSKLEAAEAALEAAKQAEAAAAKAKAEAEAVEKLIDALPQPDDVRRSDRKAIEEAREAYENLSSAARSYVSAAAEEKLSACEKALRKLGSRPSGGVTTIVSPNAPAKPSQKTPFADTTGHWAEEYINDLYAAGTITGSTGRNGRLYYRPDDSMTRQEFVVALMRYLGVNAEKYASVSLPFADAKQISAWAANAMKAAYELGYVGGSRENGALYANPTATITRQEAMTILARTMQDDTAQDTKNLNRFKDAETVAAWAREPLSKMVGKGIISGSNGRLNPTGSVTRAEVAKMLWMLANNA